jgi:hypothetical protein
MDEMGKRGLCAFTFARIGDRVFNKDHGWGTISVFFYNPPCNLIVNFDDGNSETFTLGGAICKEKYTSEDGQILFWDEECTIKPMMPRDTYLRNSVYIHSAPWIKPWTK